MKYLKLFENFNKSQIDDICEYYGITNYSINPDGSIDVDGVVDLSNMQLKEIPIKFRSGFSLDDPKEIRKTLEKEVSKQMISEVPVGCFLSGGIDSSIITYLYILFSTLACSSIVIIMIFSLSKSASGYLLLGRM